MTISPRVDYVTGQVDLTPVHAFVTNCNKCKGSGHFLSYSGRIVGPCFHCKGTGKVSHKTSPEARAKSSQARIEKKVKTVTENIEYFSTAYADVWAWINSSRSTFSFAQSIYEAVEKYGELTENQLAACERCIAKRNAALEARKNRVESAPVVETDKLMEAFDKATRNGLKTPKLRFELFTASLAPAHGRNAGAVYLKAGETYLGKIAGGKFFASREASQEQQEAVKSTMADPVAAAVAYGRRTGNCACCGRELTVKESVELGIGPICRSRFFG